jgi:hypothetical protein
VKDQKILNAEKLLQFLTERLKSGQNGSKSTVSVFAFAFLDYVPVVNYGKLNRLRLR